MAASNANNDDMASPSTNAYLRGSRRTRQRSRDSVHSDDIIAESSADENTAIVRRLPGRGTADYGAVASVDDHDQELGRRPTTAGTPVTVSKAEGPPTRKTGGPLPRRARDETVRNGVTETITTHGQEQLQRPDAELPAQEGWFRALVEKYGSVELENKGSVARDHLALERTFLAWLRTSLSFASIGIAVTQLFRLNTTLQSDGNHTAGAAAATRLRSVGKPLGATFLGISILVLLLGFHRYFESQHYVIRGKFPASRGTIVIVSVVAIALIVASLVVVVAVAPHAFER